MTVSSTQDCKDNQNDSIKEMTFTLTFLPQLVFMKFALSHILQKIIFVSLYHTNNTTKEDSKTVIQKL